MNIVLLPPSDKELDDAIEYYEAQLTGLGQRFYDEFEKTRKLMGTRPAHLTKAPFLSL